MRSGKRRQREEEKEKEDSNDEILIFFFKLKAQSTVKVMSMRSIGHQITDKNLIHCSYHRHSN